MNKGKSKTKRKIFFKSKPQLFVLASADSTHQRSIGDWIVRESYEPIDDSTLPNGIVSYSILIETEVSSHEEIWSKQKTAFELADDLNRVWTYVCGQPINAARFGLFAYNAPPAWKTNSEEVEEFLQTASSGLKGKLSIQTRQWIYCPELPLKKALDLRQDYKIAPDLIRTLIELHYSALISVRRESRLFLFANALEIVRALLPGRADKQKQNSLPDNIKNNLHESLHWLFYMANNRSDVRHVVKKGTLHPRMSSKEHNSFEHDADLFIRTVVCKELGYESFLVIHGKPNSDSK